MSGPRNIQERSRQRVGSLVKEKWRLDALLGVGGTAAVFAATHRNGKRAAIKMLHAQLSTNEELVARFLREGYAANKLDHPGVVSVLDDDRTEDGAVFLVMELLDGYSLERHARPGTELLPIDQVLRLGDELLDVLAVAHSKGVIHRDIKPANLFLTREGRLKVLDFGIARLAERLDDQTATQTGATIGTPAFMPPEQARGRWSIVDARTDIWSVGATLFAMLAGTRPRRAETVNEELLLAMTQPVPSLASLAPQLPPQLVALVDRALAFEMDQRWADARTMQVALRQVRDELAREGTPPTLLALEVDTAPVVATPAPVPSDPDPTGPMTGPELDPRLTTSRPLVTSGEAPAPRKGSAIGLAIGVAGLLSLAAAAGFAAVKLATHPTAAPAAAAHAVSPHKAATATAATPMTTAKATAPSSASASPPPTSSATEEATSAKVAEKPPAAPATAKTKHMPATAKTTKTTAHPAPSGNSMLDLRF